MRIRDPIHGTLLVSDSEKAVIDSPFFQRLRNVRQLGFGELAFPGATHTRHAHCLGAMHVAGRLFDQVASRAKLSDANRERFRAAVRLAALCHDLGHLPLSHASEQIAPPLAALGLPEWLCPGAAAPAPAGVPTQARHEHFTAKLLLDSRLAEIIRAHYAALDLTPERIAALITSATPPGGLDFEEGGLDWSPLLRAIVSGELDADRMDYLLRDSFYTGVNYGRYDLDWLVSNLDGAVKDGKVWLALSRAAAFAFEDFLLSRYHMFVSVYLHHTSVNFDHMLGQFFAEAPDELRIPTDAEPFLLCDDVALASALRRSSNRWARRILWREGFKLLAQFTERDEGYDLDAIGRALDAAGLEHFEVESRTALSRYAEEGRPPDLYIRDPSTQRLTEVARYTPLYQRYASAVRLSRAYVRPDQLEPARAVLERLTR